MKQIQISRRLLAVAGLVSKGSALADVGCDHGYIPIYLLQKGQIPRAIAMDVNPGPLMRAQEHIRAWGMENYIETRLSDGVQALTKGEVQSIVIAGMGGPLMVKILTEGADVLTDIEELVLQPQSEIGHFRRFLAERGYCIVSENMVEEEGKYYPMMRAVRGSMKYDTQAEALYGKELLRTKNPVLKEFLTKEQQNADRIFQRLRDSYTQSAKKRIAEIEQENSVRKEALAYYEM